METVVVVGLCMLMERSCTLFCSPHGINEANSHGYTNAPISSPRLTKEEFPHCARSDLYSSESSFLWSSNLYLLDERSIETVHHPQ